MLIRRLGPDELGLLRPLADASLAGEEALLRIGRTGMTLGYAPLPRAEWRVFPPSPTFAPAAFAINERSALFAAMDGENVVGVCGVRGTPEGWAEVADIRVDASCRRQGYGRTMLESCEACARQWGMAGLRAACTDTNPVMCQFLEHCGFILRGMDSMALAYTEAEREKPLARRAALLFFYRTLKG